MTMIRVLFLAASPGNQMSLQLGDEFRTIEDRVRKSEHRDSIELVSKWAVRLGDLQEALLRYRPHVVHFSGHGAEDGLWLQERDRGSMQVSGSMLTRVFEIHNEDLDRDRVQVVVFGACYSARQASAVAKQVDFAIGMRNVVGEQASIVFAADLYMALGYGCSVQKAFKIGMNAMKLGSWKADDKPELHCRKGADPAMTVLIEKGSNQIELRDCRVGRRCANNHHCRAMRYRGVRRPLLPGRLRRPTKIWLAGPKKQLGVK